MTSSQPVPRNTEIFNRVVSIVLADLYEAFPNPVNLDPSKIGKAAHVDEDDQEEIFQTVVETVASSIEFLLREGFLAQGRHFEGWDTPGFPAAVLTAKGLQLLGSIPESLEEDPKPLGSRFADAVEGGKWGIAALTVRELLSLSQR